MKKNCCYLFELHSRLGVRRGGKGVEQGFVLQEVGGVSGNFAIHLIFADPAQFERLEFGHQS